MPVPFLSVCPVFSDNWGKGVTEMEDMMATLERLGIPADERKRIREHYGDDMDGLSEYVLYMRIMLDDWHEYLA